MTQESTAHYLLEAINDLGVEYIFANMGTDHAPLIEEMARWRSIGIPSAKVILCPHENVAMHMAGGFAMLTGRAQIVIAHVDAGTANCALGAHNLARGRVPVILIAGRAPFGSHDELTGSRDNYVHFIQEPFDQAGLVRPYVKWEYDLPSGLAAKETLRRAHTVAQNEPAGPVYLTIRRETLAQVWDSSQARPYPASIYGTTLPAAADGKVLEEIARRLVTSERPLLITSYSGRDQQVPALLGELAQLTATCVVESFPTHNNISHAHPCFSGFSPNELLKDADVVILLDTDVPWIPADSQLNGNAWCVHIDVDPVKTGLPIWTFPAHVRLGANAALVLKQLIRACRSFIGADDKKRIDTRLTGLIETATTRAIKLQLLAASKGTLDAINPHYLCASLQKAISFDAVVINEAVRNTLAVLEQMPRVRAGSYLSCAGGGLGSSGGFALGAKLANPERTVVQVVGDGGFFLNNPESFFAISSQYELPILTVILDNRGWGAVKAATLRVYPKGEAARTDVFQSLLPKMNFAYIAHTVGAFGEYVDDPAELEPAIGRAIEALRDGRSALLHVRVTGI